MLLLAAANCDSNTEAMEFRVDGIDDAVALPPLLDVFDVLWWCAPDCGFPVVEFFGVGGRGELAWRFSGLGDPRLPTELVQDEEEAVDEFNFKFIIFKSGFGNRTLSGMDGAQIVDMWKHWRIIDWCADNALAFVCDCRYVDEN